MIVTLQIKIDKEHYDKAEENLANKGLSIDDAMHIFMIQAATDRDFEFGPLSPNQTTIDAINAAREGDLEESGTPEEAIAELSQKD